MLKRAGFSWLLIERNLKYKTMLLPDSIDAYAQQLSDFMAVHPKLVVLTGAGISTDSGIPDYRDSNAQWKRKPPVQHHDFMHNLAARQRFWARSLIGWPVMRDAQPNESHFHLVEMEQHGAIELLITQNVDGLHQKAGHQRVIDLHGRSDNVICMSCNHSLSRDAAHALMAAENPSFLGLQATPAPDGDADLEDIDFSTFHVSNCPICDGLLKPNVVFFGDNVPKEHVNDALNALKNADALLVIGSSLMVYSGYRFCKRAKEWNIPIAALSLGKTRADDIISLKLNAPIGKTLSMVTASRHPS